MKRFVQITSATLILSAGCAHPLDVKVVDSGSQAPVVGATVSRMDMKRPYFIVGAIVPHEQATTDTSGVAHLKDRRGMMLFISGDGYETTNATIERQLPSMTVEIKRPRGK